MSVGSAEWRSDGKYRDGRQEVRSRTAQVFAATLPDERVDIVDRAGLIPEDALKVTSSEVILDLPDDPVLAAEYYLTSPIFHRLVDKHLENTWGGQDPNPYTMLIDGDFAHDQEAVLNPRDLFKSDQSEIRFENDLIEVGSPPYTTRTDWRHAFDHRKELPVLPDDAPEEWRFQYQDRIHLTHWRLTHIPSGWESPTASRWEKTGPNEYVGQRGDFSYRVEILPGDERVAITHPENEAASREMSDVENFRGDGNPYETFEWVTEPVAMPTVEELPGVQAKAHDFSRGMKPSLLKQTPLR